MTKKPSRPRTARRAAAQANRRAVDKIERLAVQLPGGAPAQPLRVTSASVVEVRAREARCLVCDAALELRAHVAEPAAADLRRVELGCRSCGRSRKLWFRIEPPQPN
jgi:hypothetical protein